MPLLGIISDTHGLLRDDALARLQGVDHIIHAGDIGAPEIIPRLVAIAPVSAIRGNIDLDDWAAIYPEALRLTLFGQSIFLIHDRKAMTGQAEGVDLVISGHSHRASIETVGETLFLNPGSAGPRRFRLPITLALVRIDGDSLSPEIVMIG